MKKSVIILMLFSLCICLLFFNCNNQNNEREDLNPDEVTNKLTKIPVILDTDANNEIDDQHAIAYLLFNGDVFTVKAITVNATSSGGNIEDQLKESERVMRLCNLYGKIPLLGGADSNFTYIRTMIDQNNYDGQAAIEFIIQEANRVRENKLVLIPVGKLTNIALALERAPEIKDKVRIVWLGSNYPDPGEYNLVNDVPALNYILEQNVPFEMVTVRYGKSSGSDAVRVTPEEIRNKMEGAGPESEPVTGRHGGSFIHFGDYAFNLFEHIDLHGDPPSRSLFDVVAVAMVKNSSWGEFREISAPMYENEKWADRPDNSRLIGIWENFDKEAILDDFFQTMQNPIPVIKE